MKNPPPLYYTEDDPNEKNYDYPPEYFYRMENPDEKEKLLAKKKAELVKKMRKMWWHMTVEEINTYWKPLYIECGVEWLDTPTPL
jgi:hypothetical protein